MTMTREQALGAVSGWVERIRTSGDPALSLQDDAIRDAAELTQFIGGGAADHEALLALGWMLWYQHLAVGGDHDKLTMAVQALAPCFYAGVGPLPEPLLPSLADAVTGAVRSLVAQAATSTDPALVAATVALARRVLDHTPAGHDDQAGRVTWLGSALRASFRLSGDQAALDESIASFKQAVTLCPPGHPARAAVLANLAQALQPRIIRSSSPADVELAISSLDEALAGTDPANPDLASERSELCGFRHARFGYSEDPADLDQAVTAGREAVAALPAGYPDRRAILGNLATALHTRFERSGSPADLDEAIGLYGTALDQAPPDAPELAAMTADLAQLLRLRFERAGAAADLTAALTWERTSLAATPQGDERRAGRLTDLALALHQRFELTGETTGLDEAVTALREAVAGTPDAGLRAARQDALWVALQDRFEGTRVLADLDEAVAGYRAAIASSRADDPGRGWRLGNLGNALLDRFLQTGDQANLDEAITLHRAALAATPAADDSLPIRRSALGTSLRTRFGQLGQARDLDEAIALARKALAAAAAGDPARPKYLTNLGTALRDRFIRAVDQRDLDEAIPLLRAAVAAGPADGPNAALYLNNLGAALQLRYSRTGATEDMDESVDLARRALAATPPGHPRHAWQQCNVGGSLLVRHLRTGSARDLDEAIDLQRAAAADPSAGQETTTRCQYNLAAALAERFRLTGSPADLDEAIALGRTVVAATPAGHADRADQLSNLGDALWNRFDRTGSPADLNEAITAARNAVAACPPGHTRRAAALINLGVTLRSRFQGGGDPADLAEAIETLAEAAQASTARPSERIGAARTVAALLAGHDVHRAAELLATAVRLLPAVAPRELTARDRQYQLGDDLKLGAGLAGDAAALALSAAEPGADGPTQALGFLELGRAVLLTQSLETRSDLSDLMAREPALATRFTELRDALDQQADVPAESPAQDRHQLAADFRAVLARIRATPGFSGFLQPPSAGELTRHAGDGPIAVLNVSQFRSDAILVTARGITSVPLPGLRRDVVAGKITEFYTALDQANSSAATSEQRRAGQQAVAEALEWLWDAAAEPVLAELGFSQPPAAGAPWPRLWWAPGGMLGTLPVHAAGHHRAGVPGSAVMDRVVSSYTPTIRTLAYARERAARDRAGAGHDQAGAGAVSALVVAMPVTPGLPPLRFAAQEVVDVRQRIPDADVYIESAGAVTDRTPTRERILALLARAPIAHFACHGSNDPVDPARSQLYLHDHVERPLTVAALSALDMDRAQLAYLSACGTALNRNPRLLDEAIHLTAAFQLTGFARVIGTLWPIDDVISASVAGSFYAGLRAGDGAIDLTRAAAALHHAQRTARGALTDFPSLWAPYIHMGA
jgi:tetratricopeptide (TPR) repeat protein